MKHCFWFKQLKTFQKCISIVTLTCLFHCCCLMVAARRTYSTYLERKKEREREAVLCRSLSTQFSLSVRHSYLWQIRLETLIEQRGGDMLSLMHSASLSLSKCFHLPPVQLVIILNHPSICAPLSFIWPLLLDSASLFLSSLQSRASLSLSPSLSELMLSEYTSPLSLRLNKLQRGKRKREAVGQEEGRMGEQNGDEAWKKKGIFK